MTFHLTAPDPYFLDKLAFEFTAPVPPNIPARDVGTHSVPGTGPYMITRYIPGRQILFSRNPYFREWSPAAQPKGSPDRIVWAFGPSRTRGRADRRREADWTDDTLPDAAARRAHTRAVAHQSGALNHLHRVQHQRPAIQPPPGPPRVQPRRQPPPFRGPARRPGRGRPGLPDPPPGVPGYRPYCPFTADPNPSGTWVGPDLSAARKLVAPSGTRACTSRSGPTMRLPTGPRAPSPPRSCASSATRPQFTSPHTPRGAGHQ